MLFARTTAIIACLLTASSSFAAPFASPGGAATPTQVDAYQDFAAGATCTLSNETCATFSAIKGSRVLIQHVSCAFALGKGSEIQIFGVGIKDKNAFNVFPTTKTATITGGAEYVVNAQTYLFLAKGEVPQVSALATTTAPADLRCTISGVHS